MSASEAGQACDTSVLLPALVSWHPDHRVARRSLAAVDALPAHVLLETYSVLTRLPAPHRIAPQDAGALLDLLALETLTLPASRHRALVPVLADQGIRGGAVYDALVGATVQHHRRVLLTRDRRARATYDAIGVRYSLL